MRRFHPPALVALFLALFAVVGFAGCSSTNPYYAPEKTHHRPQGFVNSDGQQVSKPFSMLLRWWRERWAQSLPPPPARFVSGYGGFEVLAPDAQMLRANRTRTTVTWVGHATLLVQVGGLNVLTDPHFSERAFPVQWIGPRRRVPPAMPISALPRIDLVVISHNHYDHLDRDSVLALNAQPGGPPLFAVPLGVDLWMREQGIENVRRFDWWDMLRLPQAPGTELHFVPAKHWSSRTPFDRNATLWGGWVLRNPGFSFYFAGDTGYSARDFNAIGERFGGFDLAAIPVGAYEPRWFMGEQHVDPAQAVQIHRDVRARRSMGIHWGAFELTDEPLDAPIGALPAAVSAAGLPRDAFEVWKHGETRVFP